MHNQAQLDNSFIKIQPLVLGIPRAQAKTGQTDGRRSQKQYMSPQYTQGDIIRAFMETSFKQLQTNIFWKKQQNQVINHKRNPEAIRSTICHNTNSQSTLHTILNTTKEQYELLILSKFYFHYYSLYFPWKKSHNYFCNWT